MKSSNICQLIFAANMSSNKIVDTPIRVKTNCKLQLAQIKYSLYTELVHDLESQTEREIFNRLKTKLDIWEKYLKIP